MSEPFTSIAVGKYWRDLRLLKGKILRVVRHGSSPFVFPASLV